MEPKPPIIEPGFWHQLARVLGVVSFLILIVPMSLGVIVLPRPAGSFDSVVLIQYIPHAADDGTLVPACKNGCVIGSGVTTDNGFIITAAHVVAETWKIGDIVPILDFQGKPHDAKLLAVDPKGDVAILRYTNWASGPTSPLLCHGGYVVGDPVVVRGGPLFLGLASTFGHISRLEIAPGMSDILPDWPLYLLIDAVTTHGNSGGPVYDAYARVIGILVGATDNGYHRESGFNVVVPASAACALLTTVSK